MACLQQPDKLKVNVKALDKNLREPDPNATNVDEICEKIVMAVHTSTTDVCLEISNALDARSWEEDVELQ